MFCWHNWSKWERYLWEGEVWANIFRAGQKVESSARERVTQDRQKRHCIKCGLHQDQRIY